MKPEAPNQMLSTAILGIWRLKSRVDLDANGSVHIDPFLGRDPIAVICFGRGHFAAQFMKRDRSQLENVPQAVQVKNNTAPVNGYDAYFGTYTTDENAGTITTLIEGSISPDNIGKTFVRSARVTGNDLIIQLETTTIDGTAVTRTNTFSRVG